MHDFIPVNRFYVREQLMRFPTVANFCIRTILGTFVIYFGTEISFCLQFAPLCPTLMQEDVPFRLRRP